MAEDATRRRFRAVALDLDGTLTLGGPPDREVLDALARLRAGGMAIVLVTGRILAELVEVVPDVRTRFDAAVLENGGVLATQAFDRPLVRPVHPALRVALARRGVDVRAGEVLLAGAAQDEGAVLEEVRALGLDCHLVRNRGELMVVPAGATKASGLLHALALLGISPHDTVAVGDAENDLAMLQTAEVGVAVANAVPSLAQAADVLLSEADGHGVLELLRSGVLDGSCPVRPQRWDVLLGTDGAGAPVTISGTPANIVIAGGTGDGKSYLAGLLCEGLVQLGYSVVVLDPEGDHVGLSLLPDVILQGGDRPLPAPDALVQLLDHRCASLVVDLSHLDLQAQDRFVRHLAAELEAHRRRSGFPHWVVIDEADRAVGAGGPGREVFDPSRRGHCLVTWRPQDLGAAALAGTDVVLALGNPAPAPALVALTAAVAEVPPAIAANALVAEGTDVVVAVRGAGAVRSCRLAERATGHFRHEHKYELTGTDDARGFFFRDGPEHLTGSVARNLAELEGELARCTSAVLRHHCAGGDLSRWVRDVFRDPCLAQAIAAVEVQIGPHAPAAAVESARVALVGILQGRHDRRGTIGPTR
jgi:hydroxymethylpyrimidine pyrophosphatase-like HAD family hydrolase